MSKIKTCNFSLLRNGLIKIIFNRSVRLHLVILEIVWNCYVNVVIRPTHCPKMLSLHLDIIFLVLSTLVLMFYKHISEVNTMFRSSLAVSGCNLLVHYSWWPHLQQLRTGKMTEKGSGSQNINHREFSINQYPFILHITNEKGMNNVVQRTGI